MDIHAINEFKTFLEGERKFILEIVSNDTTHQTIGIVFDILQAHLAVKAEEEDKKEAEYFGQKDRI